jgi:hypothetical protein
MPLPDAAFRRPVHGVHLTRASDRRRATPRPPGVCRLLVRYARAGTDPGGRLLWQRRIDGIDPPVWHGLHAAEEGFRLTVRCQGRGSFTFRGNEVTIAWEPDGTGPAYYLFGLGLPLWLEQRGTPCLHANALAHGERAIGLIGESLAGKTTLTVALLQRGLSLLSDDLLTLAETGGTFRVAPGLPQLRMWPDAIAGLLPRTSPRTMARVHARLDKRLVPAARVARRRIADVDVPLDALYLLERDRTGTRLEVAVERMPPSEALLALLSYSVIGDAATALGLERGRLARLARVVDAVGVSRLRYPDGLEWLPQVCQAIVADLASR